MMISKVSSDSNMNVSSYRIAKISLAFDWQLRLIALALIIIDLMNKGAVAVAMTEEGISYIGSESSGEKCFSTIYIYIYTCKYICISMNVYMIYMHVYMCVMHVYDA